MAGVGQVRVGLDADDFISAAQKAADALLGQADSVDKLVISMQKYNASGKLLQATVSGMTTEGERLNVVIREQRGSLKTVSTVLDNTASKYKETGEAGKAGGERIILTWQSVIRIFESQVIRQGVRGIIFEFTAAVKAAADLDVKIAQIKGISGGANPNQLTAGLKGLANSYGIDQVQAAEAAYAALQSQIVNTKNAIGFLDSAFKLSVATGTDVKDSIKLLSTTMNAFQINVVNSDKVANTLFHTMTNGAVDSNTFASSFGQLANIAAGSGLRLEEVAAALETLQEKGVKFTDAARLIEDVLRSVTKPTAEMKELFKELGVSSGEALIALKGGFGGLLETLDKEAGKGNQHLGDLLGSFNNIRAVSNLTGTAFDSYNQNLQKVSNSTQELNNATRLVQQSIGKEFQAELARTRTYLEDTFGTEVARKLLSIAKAIGGDEGIVGVLQKLVPLLKAGVLAFGAYKATVIATTAITAANTVVTNFSIAATIAKTRAIIAQTTALAANNAAVTLGLSLAAAYIAYQALKPEENVNSPGSLETGGQDAVQKFTEYLEAQKKAKGNVSEDAQRNENLVTEGVRTAFDTRYSLLLRYSANVISEAEKLRLRAVGNLKDINEAVNNSASTYYSALEKRVTDFKHSATEAGDEVKRSLKLAEDLAKRASDAAFAEKLKYANSGTVDSVGGIAVQDERELLLKGRIRELQRLAAEEYQKGTKDSVTEARKAYDEITSLQRKLFENQTDLQKKQFEAAATSGRIGPSGIDPLSGKPRFDFTVHTAEIERQITAERQKQAVMEEEYRKQQKEREASANAAAEAEKTRLNALRALITEAAKFSALDDKGKIKDEFKKDPALAARQYQEIVNKIDKLTGTSTDSEEFKIFIDLQSKKKSIVQEVQTELGSIKAKAAQEDILRERKLSLEAIKNNEDVIKSSKAKYDSLNKDVAYQTDISEKRIGTTARAFAERSLINAPAVAIQRLPGLGGNKAAYEEDEAIARSASALAKYKEAIEEVRLASKKLAEEKTPAAALNLADAIDKRTKLAEEYLISRTGKQTDQITLPGEKPDAFGKVKTASDRLADESKLSGEIRKTAEAENTANDALNKRLDGVDKLDKAIRRIPEANNLVADTADEAKEKVTAAYNQMNTKAEDYISKLREIAAIQSQLHFELPEKRGDRNPEPGPVPIPNLIPPVPGNMFGGTRYYGTGGVVGFEPRGSDQYAAMLAKGERVINADASAKFAPLLEAINSGAIRSPTQQSSQVTNVGDIHINYTGQQNVGTDVRELGKQLRRAIQRGEVNLT